MDLYPQNFLFQYLVITFRRCRFLLSLNFPFYDSIFWHPFLKLRLEGMCLSYIFSKYDWLWPHLGTKADGLMAMGRDFYLPLLEKEEMFSSFSCISSFSRIFSSINTFSSFLIKKKRKRKRGNNPTYDWEWMLLGM